MTDELEAKVKALHLSGMDADMVVKLIIDVVARGLGKLGGRPAKEPTQVQCAPVATPVEPVSKGQASIKFDAAEPVSKHAETSNPSVCDPNSGSALVLSSPDPIQNSSSDRRFNEPLPPGFADFWALYPRRVGRGDAIKAWVKGAPPADLVRTAVIWQVEAWDAENPPRPIEKIPHPATWLNGRRWLDEKPAPRKPAPHPRDVQYVENIKKPFPRKATP